MTMDLQRPDEGRSGGRRGPVRIGDAERQEAVEALTEHYVAGRLTLGEVEERLRLAQGARTPGDLERLFVDLPAAVHAGAPRRRRPARPPLPITAVLAALWLVAVVSATARIGFPPPPLLLLPLLWLYLAGRRRPLAAGAARGRRGLGA